MVGAISLASLIFITQICYNFRRHKSDLTQCKLGTEKFWVQARQFFYERILCNNCSCFKSNKRLENFKRAESRDALDAIDTFGRGSPFTISRQPRTTTGDSQVQSRDRNLETSIAMTSIDCGSIDSMAKAFHET